jgi:flagellar motility protein MotE (MotC chaperone)
MITGHQINMKECSNDNYIFSLFFAYCIVISSIFSITSYFIMKSLAYINKVSKWQNYFISNNCDNEANEEEENTEENTKTEECQEEKCQENHEITENTSKCCNCCDCKCEKKEKKEITTDELINRLIEIKKSLSNLKTLEKVNEHSETKENMLNNNENEIINEIKPYNEDCDSDKMIIDEEKC